MTHTRLLPAALVASAALLIAGCSASDDPAPADDDAPPAPSAAPTSGGEAPAEASNGVVTVTVDGDTWEFTDRFWCAVGYAETSSDEYSFSSDARGDFDGVTVQFQLNARDASGGDQVEGDGVEYDLTLFDISNPTDPSVSIQGFAESGVTIAPPSVSADTTFTDFDGVAHAVTVDGTCAP